MGCRGGGAARLLFKDVVVPPFLQPHVRTGSNNSQRPIQFQRNESYDRFKLLFFSFQISIA